MFHFSFVKFLNFNCVHYVVKDFCLLCAPWSLLNTLLNPLKTLGIILFYLLSANFGTKFCCLKPLPC